MRISKKLLPAIVLLVLSCPCLLAIAQQARDVPPPPGGASEALDKDRLEREKYQNTLDLENKKLELEREKQALEREKNESTKDLENRKLVEERNKFVVSTLAIAIPILVTAITIYDGMRRQRQQAQDAQQARKEEAESEFELKVAEIAMNAPGPQEVLNRAKLLYELFPQRLSKKTLKEFDPAKHGRLAVPEGRKELMRLLAANPDKQDEILQKV